MPIENKKQILLIIVAIVIGAMATFATGKYVSDSVQQKTQELHDQYEAQQKQMASQLQQQSQQQMAALQGQIAQVRQEQQAAMQQASQAMQQAQQAAMQQAQTVQQGMSRAKNNSLLTNKTPSGKRAVTVMIDSLNAVGGLLNAGDFVDVIAHLDVPQQTSEKTKSVTAMVFQDLQVLAINTNLDDPGAYTEQQNAQTLKITFAVDPQEAGLLSFANKNGRLELALRSKDENGKQTVKASTWKTLADYVLQNQGEAFDVPGESEESATSSSVTKEESDNKPSSIQIFRGGKEL